MLKELFYAIALFLNRFNFKQLQEVNPFEKEAVNKNKQVENQDKVETPSVDTKPIPEIKTDTVKVDTVKIEPKVDTVKKFEIIDMLLPESQTMGKRKYDINQIVLHFTCSSTAKSAINWWKETPVRVGVGYIIDNNGLVYRTIKDDEWAFSLGIDFSNNDIPKKYKNRNHVIQIEQSAIGIEIVSPGGLIKKENKFYFEGGDKYILEENVVTLENPFRGYKYYAKFTQEQMESCVLLIQYLKVKHNLDIKYRNDMYDINLDALQGKKGLFSHTCYRSDKQDIYYYKPFENLLKKI